jgi:hypothetical protein
LLDLLLRYEEDNFGEVEERTPEGPVELPLFHEHEAFKTRDAVLPLLSSPFSVYETTYLPHHCR